MTPTLTLYNSLSRTKETFVPMEPGKVRMYTCGPTVYHYAHIGNLRSYIFPDILKKVLWLLGYEVKHIINITDVGHLTSDADSGDDKVEKAAAREGKSAWDVTRYFADAFVHDIQALNIALPTQFTWATQYIPQQIELVQTLETKGFTYITEDGVYYDTAKFPTYTALARIDVAGLEEGARVDVKDKRHKTDFALWKFSPPDEQRQMEWESPWGKGFPGWHLECSAMIMAELGPHIDIHTGGRDHLMVHHTNEIAQSEAATGEQFVNYWLHGEFLVLDQQQRMGKSEGNFLTLQTLLDEGFHPLAYRYLALNSHYRQFLSFSFEILKSAQNGYFNLKRLIHQITSENTTHGQAEAQAYHERLLAALTDDLNVPKALGVLWEMLKDHAVGSLPKLEQVRMFDAVLSLNLLDAADLPELSREVPTEVQTLAQQRWDAKQQRNFAEADRLRQVIHEQGFSVKDSKDGYEVVPLI